MSAGAVSAPGAVSGGERVAGPFEPVQVTRSYVQTLHGTPERILPLLTWDGEKLWARGWEPTVLLDTGERRAGTVFRTPGSEGRADSVWVCDAYEPTRGYVRYARMTPRSNAVELDVSLEAAGADRTRARVRYTYTALTEAGAEVVRAMTEEAYAEFMREWEEELNHFLRTGQKLGEAAPRVSPSVEGAEGP